MQLLKNNWAGILIFLVFLALLYNIIVEDRKEKLLNNSKITFGFLIKEYHESIKFNQGIFQYFIGKNKYELKSHGDFSFLKIGDTVLIKYAIENPSVAEVINFCYMDRHKGKKYCNCD